MPEAYSHTPDQLARELRTAGLDEVEILGIEGPGWPLLTADASPDLLDRALRAARLYDGYAEPTAGSAHLLGCARATLMR